MGICKYCKKDSGLLRNEHKECKIGYENGKQRIIRTVKNVMRGITSNDDIENEVTFFANKWNLEMSEVRPILIEGWEKALDVALEDNVISESEESNLVALQQFFNLENNDLDKSGAFTRLVKSCVLREVMNGVIPDAFKYKGLMPINLQKGERIIWGFNAVEYYEHKMKTEYVGGYSGFSVRIAKGLYYRMGAFNGTPVVTTNTVYIDTGIMMVTNINVYFTGSIKSFRIPFRKVVSYQPYSDAIGITKDTANAKQQLFKTGDGWFTYNLITNLSNKAE